MTARITPHTGASAREIEKTEPRGKENKRL
jgi:hypothetical protein